MYEKILVPIDGSTTAARGLKEAARFAQLTRGSLRLVHVLDDFPLFSGSEMAPVNPSEVLAEIRKRGEGLVSRARAEAADAGVPVETVLRERAGRRVCDVVLDEAKAAKADLIVVGTHGRRGPSRFFLGSDAEQIVRQAPVPVLLIRGTARNDG